MNSSFIIKLIIVTFTLISFSIPVLAIEDTFITSVTTYGSVDPEEPPVIPEPLPPVIDSGGGGGGSQMLLIQNLSIVSEVRTAGISFTTTKLSKVKIEWGLTEEYEEGSTLGIFYEVSHDIVITGLKPGVEYKVRINVTDNSGITVSQKASFITKIPYDLDLLPNPSDFRAIPVNENIGLSWENPEDERFSLVRIMRSEKFFPRDQNDGILVYEGISNEFLDENVNSNTLYYYTIFTRGKDGTFSSGAIVSSKFGPEGVIYEDPFKDIRRSEIVDPIIGKLTLADFEFYQRGKLLPIISEDRVAIHGGQKLTVRLKYEKVPEILKTIVFVLSDPQDEKKTFSFLLRINEDKTYYDATIGELGRSGEYKMKILVLDYENQAMKEIEGSLKALAFVQATNFRDKFDPLGLLLIIIAMLVLMLIMYLKRHSEKKTEFHYSNEIS